MKVNGEVIDISSSLEKGYVKLHRLWQSGDQVELNLSMPVEKVQAHPQVRANCGRIALQRGPLVYCLEEIDNGKNLNDLILPSEEKLTVKFEPDLLGGVSVITGAAKRRQLQPWQDQLYHADRAVTEKISFKAIPYFTWANRAPGEMLVWMREE